jgi:hypothetical protein
MPLYFFRKDTTLTDATFMAAGWQYLAPSQLDLIPNVSLELAQAQAVPHPKDAYELARGVTAGSASTFLLMGS